MEYIKKDLDYLKERLEKDEVLRKFLGEIHWQIIYRLVCKSCEY